MSRVTTFVRFGMTLLTVGVLLGSHGTGLAVPLLITNISTNPKLIITEVQMNGVSASQEFIELYNTTSEPLQLGGSNASDPSWKLQFFAASTVTNGAPNWTQPTTTINVSGIIPGHGYLILASNGYQPYGVTADQHFSYRMTTTGGGLQLTESVADTNTVHDRLMWRTDASAGQNIWPTPPNDSSLQRIPNEDEEYSLADSPVFTTEGLPSPKAMWTAPIVEEPIDEPLEADTEVNAGLLSPLISELLPNPAAPLKDELDEFIELYNPNTEPFNLKGYSLEVESSSIRAYTIRDDIYLPALEYVAFYSGDTKLSLTNTTGTVRLLDIADETLSETATYTAAKENAGWVKPEANWIWTTTPTPGLANIISVADPPKSTTTNTLASQKKAAKASTAKATKKTTAKKAVAKKPKAAKKAAKPKIATVASMEQPEPKPMIHNRILVLVAGLAVLYGAYEYRHDIANKFRRSGSDRNVRS